MRHTFAFASILVLAVAAAGCGGSSTSGSPATTSVAATTSVTATSSTGGSMTTSSSSSSSSSASSSSSSSSSSTSFASTKNCSQLVSLGTKLSQSLEAQSGSGATALQAQANVIKQAASAAPSAIRGDIETLAAAFSTYASKLKASGFKPGSTPTATQLAGLAAVLQSFSTPKVRTAAQNIETWAKKNCKGAG